LVQNHILGCRDPGRFAKERCLKAPPQHFLIEGLRTGQPEIYLQRRTRVDGVELMRWLVDRADRSFLDVEIATEFLKNERDGGRGKLYDEVSIVHRAWNAPGAARHLTAKVIDHASPVQTAQAIHQQFAFGHPARASS